MPVTEKGKNFVAASVETGLLAKHEAELAAAKKETEGWFRDYERVFNLLVRAIRENVTFRVHAGELKMAGCSICRRMEAKPNGDGHASDCWVGFALSENKALGPAIVRRFLPEK